MNGVLTSLALVMLFVLIGGYFSGSELAVLTLRDSQADRLPGRRGARVRKLRTDPSRFLASVQVGVTFAGFFASAYGGSTLSEPLGALLTGCGLPAGVDRDDRVRRRDRVHLLPLARVRRAGAQAARAAAGRGRRAVRLPRARRRRQGHAPGGLAAVGVDQPHRADARLDPRAGSEEVTEEELRDMVSTNGELGAEERRVLTDVFGAADRQLNGVMVPRTEVEFLPAATLLADAARGVLDKPHSRYPVIGETVDDVVGVVHVRDLFTAALRRPGRPHRRRHRPPRSAAARQQAGARVADRDAGQPHPPRGGRRRVRRHGRHRDDGGHPRGARRGDRGRVRPGRSRRGADSTEFDGLLHRDELAALTDIVLPEGPYETLAGFVQAGLGRIPAVGDTLEAHGHRFTVVEMDGTTGGAGAHRAPDAPTPEDTEAERNGAVVTPER